MNKKLLYLITASLLILAVLTACSQTANTTSSEARPEKTQEPSSPASPSAEKTQTPDSSPSPSAEPESQAAAIIETLTEGDSIIEYVIVGGLPDITVQEQLNDRLKDFFTMVLIRIEHENKNINATAKYAFIGDKYLSVRAYGTEYASGAAYPVNTLNSEIFDLETGESAGSLSDFIKAGMELKLAITSEEFVQTYPETPIDGAIDVLAAEMVDNAAAAADRFYLTEKGVGLYVTDRIHAEGDYWTFEANYSDIKHTLLTQKLLEALNLE